MSNPAWGEDVKRCEYSGPIWERTESGGSLIACILKGFCEFYSDGADCRNVEYNLSLCKSRLVSITGTQLHTQHQAKAGYLTSDVFDPARCSNIVYIPSLSLSVSPNVTPIIYGKAQTERTLHASVSFNRDRGFRNIFVSASGSSSFYSGACGSNSCSLGTFTPDVK